MSLPSAVVGSWWPIFLATASAVGFCEIQRIEGMRSKADL